LLPIEKWPWGKALYKEQNLSTLQSIPSKAEKDHRFSVSKAIG